MSSTSRVLVFASALVTIAGCNPPPVGTDANLPDVPAIACDGDEDCDDGLFCNGVETCTAGACAEGTPPTCDDGLACTVSSCAEDRRDCVHRIPDADGDGFGVLGCGDGTDCDDENEAVFPGALEICDAVDDDCDPATLGGNDFDGDGHIPTACCNPQASGPALCGTDCDDNAVTSRPGALEVCDGRDQNCDGVRDEGVDVAMYADLDHDGVGAGEEMRACAGSADFSLRDDDCDDADPDRYPDAPELCDTRDNDCDAETDEDTRAVRWYLDADGDGFGLATDLVVSCAPVSGRSTRGTDCNDGSSAIHPAADEACNGIDDDCNGLLDYEVALNDWEDDDGDGIVDAACAAVGGDCDDTNPLVGGGSSELCDGSDNDCDGTIDEDVTSTPYFRDIDGDGYGSEASGAVNACSAPPGFSSRGGDCADHAVTRHPGASEICDASDDDCDSAVDEACISRCTGAGEVSCGGTCIDARTDERFCGATAACTGAERGTTCDSGALCSGGECAEAFLVPNGERVDWGPRERIAYTFAIPDTSGMLAIYFTLDGSTPRLSPTTRVVYDPTATIELEDGQTIRWIASRAGGGIYAEQRYTHHFDATAGARPGLVPDELDITAGPAGARPPQGAGALAMWGEPIELAAQITAWRGDASGPVQLVISVDGVGPIWCQPLIEPTASLQATATIPELTAGLHAVRMEITMAAECAADVSMHPVSGEGLLVGTILTSTADCAGTRRGPARLDHCGVCDATPANDCVMDCAGVWGGPSRRDFCGVCDADSGNDCPADCNGTIGGSAFIDVCNDCVGGTTGLTPCPTVRLVAVADTYLSESSPDLNFGTASTMEVGAYVFGFVQEERVLLRFDLSSVPGEVRGARLEATSFNGFAYGDDGNVYAHLVADDGWVESEVTWNTQPSFDPTRLAYWWLWYDRTPVDQRGQAQSPALAVIVGAEHAGDGVVSFLLRSPGYDTEYYTRELDDPLRQPTLEVGYWLPP